MPCCASTPLAPAPRCRAVRQVRALQGGVGLAKLRLKEAMAAIQEGKPLLVGDLEVCVCGVGGG